MKHPGIINEIASSQWAMRYDSFDAMLAIIEGENEETNIERATFHSLAESDRYEAFGGNLGDRVDGTQLSRVRENIGILDIDGPIVSRVGGVSKVSGLTSIQGLCSEFQALEKNEEIEHIVLLLDTPGGVVKGTSDFAAMISRCTKNVTAYVWGMAASAGYWIASAADEIVSADTGIAGSIGVVLKYDVNKATGLGKIVSSQSPNKQAEMTSAKGRKSAQRLVDDLASVFIDTVAGGRGVSAETVKEKYGKGDVFVAQEALERGMIDRIMSLGEFMDSLGEADSAEEPPYAGLTISNANLNFENPDLRITSYTDGDIAIDIGGEIPPKQTITAGASTQATATTGGQKMTLKELMAENSGLKDEIEAIKKESYELGASSVQARIDQVVPYFENADYPKQIAALGIKVLKGEHSADALVGAVTVFDAQAEHDKLRGAVSDSEAVPATPAQQPEALSDDGLVRTQADEAAMLQRLGSN